MPSISKTIKRWIHENYGRDQARALEETWLHEAYLGNMEPDARAVFLYTLPQNPRDDLMGTWAIGNDPDEDTPVMRASCGSMYDNKTSCLLADAARCQYSMVGGCYFSEAFFGKIVRRVHETGAIINELSVRAMLIDAMQRHKNKQHTAQPWQAINAIIDSFQRKRIGYNDMLATFYIMAHEDVSENADLAKMLVAFAEIRVPFGVKIAMADQILGVPTVCRDRTSCGVGRSIGRNLGKILIHGLMMCSMLPAASAGTMPAFRPGGITGLTISAVASRNVTNATDVALPTIVQLDAIPDVESTVHSPPQCRLHLWKKKNNPFQDRYFADGDDVVNDIRAFDERVTARIIKKYAPAKARGARAPKRALFVLGGPGTGKSGALKKGLSAYAMDADTATYVNTDELRSELPGYQELIQGLGSGAGGVKISDNQAAAKYHHQAKVMSNDLFQDAVTKNNNIIFDGTGGNAVTLADRMRTMRAQGYEINVVHTQLDAGLAARRAEQGLPGRGYRNVPDDVIRESNPGATYDDIMAHLKPALPYMNNLGIINTGSRGTSLVPMIGNA